MEIVNTYELKDIEEAKNLLKEIRVDTRGIEIMAEKAIFRLVRLQKVPIKAANIIKQTFLSKGGEAAVSKAVVTFSAEYTDVILMGTLKQYRQALKTLSLQPFGLKTLAVDLEKFLFTPKNSRRN